MFSNPEYYFLLINQSLITGDHFFKKVFDTNPFIPSFSFGVFIGHLYVNTQFEIQSSFTLFLNKCVRKKKQVCEILIIN